MRIHRADVGREGEFPFPERRPGPSDEILEALARAARAYDDPALAKAACGVARRRPASDLNLTVAADAPATTAPLVARSRPRHRPGGFWA